jgi:hypothetical protein
MLEPIPYHTGGELPPRCGQPDIRLPNQGSNLDLRITSPSQWVATSRLLAATDIF